MLTSTLRTSSRRITQLEEILAQRTSTSYSRYLQGLTDEKFRQEIRRKTAELVAEGYLVRDAAGGYQVSPAAPPEDRELLARFILAGGADV